MSVSLTADSHARGLEASEPAGVTPMNESAQRDRRPEWVRHDRDLCHYPYRGRSDDTDPALALEYDADTAQAEAHYAAEGCGEDFETWLQRENDIARREEEGFLEEYDRSEGEELNDWGAL